MSATIQNSQNQISTRQAYGQAIVAVGKSNPNVVVLDGEVGNSTFAEGFQKAFPERYIECFIAEQNMVSTAMGLSIRGKIPFASTFAAFFARAFDQIRMAQYSDPNLNLVGSHCGVSIGQDGFSQMALEDIAMISPLLGSVVLYPSDGPSTNQLVAEMAKNRGLHYLRTTRANTNILYKADEQFVFGGSKTHRVASGDPIISIVGAGITLHEALKAQKSLLESGVNAEVIDLYSIKPLDTTKILEVVESGRPILVVEDHYQQGGIYSSICGYTAPLGVRVHSLAVKKMPRSGKPEELLRFMEIDSEAIYKTAISLVG